MTSPLRRRLAVLSAVLSMTAAGLLTSASTAAASEPVPLNKSTRFFAPAPQPEAVTQIGALLRSGAGADARAIIQLERTAQAVWFTSGTPEQVRKAVRNTSTMAAVQRSVPTMVIYNVPGRDCSQYSSGGAGSDAAYRAWVDGFAAGLRRNQLVTVVVEPDGLANLPSDCPGA